MRDVQHSTHGGTGASTRPDFYRHLTVYVLVNLLLVVINLVAWHGYFWAAWPIAGWGIGIAVHALGVFVFDWNDRHHGAPHPHG